ncbi:hypothetical protein ICL16_24465 [Iningainema sp. BLCCT55]|uniref:GST C-terminal domain-containing protein n=2 Tax=Iningainema TaxID=1932705 RepID=A0A8J6XRA8_9CYAN|nr:hypothetical protein [Iningainema tapete BLCC-T55]
MLDQLEYSLNQSQWLCGATYSLADVVWTAVLNRWEELKFAHLWEGGKRRALATYFEHLKARPSFQEIQKDTMPIAMTLAGLRRIFLGF